MAGAPQRSIMALLGHRDPRWPFDISISLQNTSVMPSVLSIDRRGW